jgi:hypothetical protein
VKCLYRVPGAAAFNIEDVAATAQPLFSGSAQRRKLRWVIIIKIFYFGEVGARFAVAAP